MAISGSPGRELVADTDRAGANDVRAEASTVHERAEAAEGRGGAQDAAAVEAGEVGARLAQPAAAAARFAKRELAADERVEIGASHDDVAAGVGGRGGGGQGG